jgi:hypothetical protein
MVLCELVELDLAGEFGRSQAVWFTGGGSCPLHIAILDHAGLKGATKWNKKRERGYV